MIKVYKIKRRIKSILGLLKPSNTSIRKDIKVIRLESEMAIVVYWKMLTHGKGPALVFKLKEQELLKFDCFGQGKGHFHICANHSFEKRIMFMEKTAKEQVEKTMFELTHNLPAYMSIMNRGKISTSQEDIKGAIEEARLVMLGFLNDIPELSDI